MAEEEQQEKALKGLEAALEPEDVTEEEEEAPSPAVVDSKEKDVTFVDFETSPSTDLEVGGVEDVSDELLEQRKKEVRERAAKASFFHVAYYQPYFDVDTKDVSARLISSLLPLKGPVVDDSNEVDLYGPFWVSTTLIFLMAISAYFAQFLEEYTNYNGEGEYNWMYDYGKIPAGALTFYGYIGLIPLILWGVGKFHSLGFKFISLVCVVGYKFVAFIPVSILCFIPSEIVRWILVVLLLAHTCWYDWISLGSLINQAPKRVMIILWSGIAVANLALILEMKLYFFST
uniref:Protein YIPF n=1 Tax=Palpitomonas bilix TaxID=652834 RepID=A0A7S3D6J1_9EUKA|mmetsp:Transcript_24474/g.61955  ORF Transcript_24474/g.61955 Transcript_24474/m.61955 type:complete len:288 (+) Transcript_24474:174-1037(+)